jgi:hypothetical protein
MEVVKGLITAEKTIVGIIGNAGAVVAEVKGDSSKPRYTGVYEVIPKVTPQTLHTGDHTMTGDVLVLDIPYHEVDNPSGGKTATIG